MTSARRSLWERASIVWLVPLLALVAALAVAWQSFRETGPLVRIVFDDAAGVVAKETELRFRNVTVGLVESVQFTAGLEQVLVSVRLDPEVAPYVDEDARFWVVRPRITTQQITGIETVLSGVFIEGIWDARPGEPRERFEGLDDAPLLGPGQEGLEFTLYSTDGTLTSATPLLYQGVVVGSTGEPRLLPDGGGVEADAVVFAPYDALVTEATKFWDASGFRLSVGSGGADIDFDSLGALIQGGLAFDDFVSGAAPLREGARVRAFYSEDLARDSLTVDPDTPSLELSAVFTGLVAGLAEGAAVELEGLRVGDVTDVRTLIDPERFGDGEIRLQASFTVQPSRLGLEGEAGRDEILAWLQERVDGGLRVRLATASILGGLKVQFAEVPGAPAAQVDLAALPFPAFPVTAPDVTDIGGTAEGLIERVDNLPIEELLLAATSFLDNAGTLVGSADAQAVPGEVRGLLADVRALAASDEVRALPAEARAALARIEGAAEGLGAILDDVEARGGVERALTAVDAAGQAASAVSSATEGLPGLVARLDAVAAKVGALPVEPILAELQGVAAATRGLLADPAIQSLPGQVGQVADGAARALAEAQSLVAEARAAELPGRLADTLTAVAEVAATIDASTEGLPVLIGRLDAIAGRAQALDLQPLLDEATGLAASARALVASPGTQALPGDLSSALAEVEGLLREAREGDVVGSVNATLASARSAAESLPALVARASALLDQATATVAGFDSTSGVVREAQAAIRDVAEAASAVARLARAIERNPNSLIFGD